MLRTDIQITACADYYVLNYVLISHNLNNVYQLDDSN